MERTNALAELATKLGVVCDIANRGCTEETCVGKVVRKAQRIVAELAKIEDFDSTKYTPAAYAMYLARFIGSARAIAEEGAGDGK